MTRSAVLLVTLVTALAQSPALHSQTKAADTGTIHINVNLVQVDASVTDSKDRPVRDLKAKDFEVRQDGKVQAITNFSYITIAPLPAAAPKTEIARGKNAPPPPPVPVKPEDARRTIALVVDDLGLSFESIVHVRDALKKFVDEQMQPGDLVAILRTGAGMGALQQFTSDKRLLYSAIEHVKYNSLGRVGVSSVAPLGGDDSSGGASDDEREQIFAAGSLGAINYVVEGLRELPGRKSAILFSENMRLLYDDGNSVRVQDSIRRLVDAANRSSVVIYTIDPRGLQTLSLTAADNTRGMTARQISAVPQQRSQQEFNSRDGLVILAHDTGGLFLYNTNDINGALRKAVADSEGYYLIGYRPEASTFDAKTGQPKFHNVSVRVKVAGLHVRSRSGFFGASDSLRPPQPKTRDGQLQRALTSPFNSGAIHVRLTALFSVTSAAEPFLDMLLHIDAKDLRFTDEPDDWHKAVLDIVAITYGDNGQPVDSSGRTYTLRLHGDQYRQALNSGFTYTTIHPIKKPGAYQMRVALRDGTSEEVGSASQFIEAPDIAKGRLTLTSLILHQYVPAAAPAADGKAPEAGVSGNPAVRVFKPGEDILYGYQVLNAAADASKRPTLETQTRVFRDGAQIYEGKPIPFNATGQADPKRLVGGGVITLGGQMIPGDYVLQIVVTDKLAGAKYGSTSQWMDFEVQK